jgi:MFS family permease
MPEIIIDLVLSFGTDAVLHKWSTYWYILAISLASLAAPILMGLMRPSWPYWYMEFWAMIALPVANDGKLSRLVALHSDQYLHVLEVFFIVGALIIADSFPDSKQALAGAVMNTVYQFGSSVGLGLMAVVSSTVTDDSAYHDKDGPPALLQGYRAAFWTCLGVSGIYVGTVVLGLRRIGKVGMKRD